MMNSSSPNTLIINSYNSHSIADCSSPVNRTSSRPVNVGGNFVIRNGVRLRYLLRAEWRLVRAGGEVRPTLVQVADGPLERVETAPVPGPATRVLRYCHITPDQTAPLLGLTSHLESFDSEAAGVGAGRPADLLPVVRTGEPVTF